MIKKKSDESSYEVLNEQGRWQRAIYSLLVKITGDDSIDGSGCDSGDPLDLTLAEIGNAFNLMTGWNRVEDDLQDDDIEVLVYSKEFDRFHLAHRDDSEWISDAGDLLIAISHWMEPIPPQTSSLQPQA